MQRIKQHIHSRHHCHEAIPRRARQEHDTLVQKRKGFCPACCQQAGPCGLPADRHHQVAGWVALGNGREYRIKIRVDLEQILGTTIQDAGFRQAQFRFGKFRDGRCRGGVVITRQAVQADQSFSVKIIRYISFVAHPRHIVIHGVQSAGIRMPPTGGLHRSETCISQKVSGRCHADIGIEQYVQSLRRHGLLLAF